MAKVTRAAIQSTPARSRVVTVGALSTRGSLNGMTTAHGQSKTLDRGYPLLNFALPMAEELTMMEPEGFSVWMLKSLAGGILATITLFFGVLHPLLQISVRRLLTPSLLQIAIILAIQPLAYWGFRREFDHGRNATPVCIAIALWSVLEVWLYSHYAYAFGFDSKADSAQVEIIAIIVACPLAIFWYYFDRALLRPWRLRSGRPLARHHSNRNDHC